MKSKELETLPLPLSSKPSELLLSDGSLASKKPERNTRKKYLRPIWYADAKDPITTQQNFKEECDINNIMRRFEKTGELPNMIRQNPVYGDFSDVPTFTEAMNTVIRANEQFDALSSKIRAQFNNDPAEFLAFVHDPKNNEELVKMGLATERIPDPTPTPKNSTSSKSTPKSTPSPQPSTSSDE